VSVLQLEASGHMFESHKAHYYIGLSLIYLLLLLYITLEVAGPQENYFLYGYKYFFEGC
jgi:hypothetical protein